MTSRDTLKMVTRNLRRRPLRSLLTLLGVALAVTLVVGIESFSAGMRQAFESGDKARTLMVYRKNRYCPQTSILPERYLEEIESVPGVVSALPVKVFLNNCRTNLDMITFEGTPVERLLAARDIDVYAGSLDDFRNQPDAALVGRDFAKRRNLTVGDKFRFGEIVVKVVGLFTSADTIQESVVLTHLEFLQRAGSVDRLGTVTQFEVRIAEPERAKEIAREIDRRLATMEEPTHTRPMSAFLARATRDLKEVLSFGRIFGIACVAVMLVLVANTVYMSVAERRREMGVLVTFGFKARHLVSFVFGEALFLALGGGLVGLGAAYLLIRTSGLSIGVEGVQIRFDVTPSVMALAVGLSLACAIVASAFPAWRASRDDAITSLRSLA